MNLSIDSAHDADTYNQASGDPVAPKPRRPRKPRISSVELEQAAFLRGYDAGLAVPPGGDLLGVVIGGLGGAGAMAIIWAVVHFFG